MEKASNGTRYPAYIKKEAVVLRRNGRTHREIAHELGISLGIACLWTKNIPITALQREAIQQRKNKHIWSQAEKNEISRRLSPYRTKYTKEDLLAKIRDFHSTHGRIPLKREFNAWDIYKAHFRSWNKAIKAAGFDSNPVVFAKKSTATDGHKCDSFTEKIIDEWLYENDIEHERHLRYGRTKLTADFFVKPNIIIEFFGLAGVQKGYDQVIEKKKELAKKLGYRFVEIYPDNIYPKNQLAQLLPHLLK